MGIVITNSNNNITVITISKNAGDTKTRTNTNRSGNYPISTLHPDSHHNRNPDPTPHHQKATLILVIVVTTSIFPSAAPSWWRLPRLAIAILRLSIVTIREWCCQLLSVPPPPSILPFSILMRLSLSIASRQPVARNANVEVVYMVILDAEGEHLARV